jgi:periplasmic protein TonB
MSIVLTAALQHKTISHNKTKAFAISVFVHLLLLFAAISLSVHIIHTAPQAQKLVKISLAMFAPHAVPVAHAQQMVHKIVHRVHKSVVHPKVHKSIVHPKRKVIHKVKVHKHVVHAIQKVQPKPSQKSALLPKPAVHSLETVTSQLSKKSRVVRTSAKPVASPRSIAPQKTNTTSKPPKASGSVSASTLAQIRKLIQSALIYPIIARKLGVEGVVIVSFVLTKKGVIQQAKIVTTSGSDSLDTEALNTIYDLSGNYPKLTKKISIQMPISFTLSNS